MGEGKKAGTYRLARTFAAGTFLQVAWGLDYTRETVIGATLKKKTIEKGDIKLSFRIPVLEAKMPVIVEGDPYQPPNEPNFPEWFKDLQQNFKDLLFKKSDVNLNVFDDFVTQVEKFTDNLKTGFTVGAAKVTAFKTMKDSFDNPLGGKVAIQFIKEKVAQAAKKVLQALSPLTTTTLMGIDVIYTVPKPLDPRSYDPGKCTLTFVLVHHRYTEVSAEFPLGTGHSAKFTGALGKEEFVQLYP